MPWPNEQSETNFKQLPLVTLNLFGNSVSFSANLDNGYSRHVHPVSQIPAQLIGSGAGGSIGTTSCCIITRCSFFHSQPAVGDAPPLVPLLTKTSTVSFFLDNVMQKPVHRRIVA
jgi:hypothetical protein